MRPEVHTESVEDLVSQVLDARIRIPVFSSDLAWDGRDVCELFDSIHRSFPIGVLLLREAPAEAAEVRVGPIPVMAIEREDTRWVVDGQRRLTSLAVALGRSLPLPPTPLDPFVVYFDPVAEAFRAPPGASELEPAWVPLPLLFDAARLTTWISSWRYRDAAGLRTKVIEAGKRLRDYRVPVYVARTDDEELLRTLFTRVHGSGKSIPWDQLREGLFERGRSAPSSLAALADELTKLGMGRPEEGALLPCLATPQGLDATQDLEPHARDAPTAFDAVAAAALPSLRRALGFLRSECKIPHLDLLPHASLLVVLARFFRWHPTPNDRTQTLLPRWIWRTLSSSAPDDRAFQDAAIAAITPDEEASMQALLRLAPASRADFAIPAAFDARDAASRLVLLGMAAMGPRDLEAGQPIHMAGLLREHGADALPLLFPLGGAATHGPANRLLLPGDGAATAALRAFIDRHGPDDPVLRSHAVDPVVAAALHDDDPERALARRAQLLANSLDSLSSRMAAWGRSDRPSLEYLMKQASA